MSRTVIPDFKPTSILEYDAWYLLFHIICDIPVETPGMNDYTGSIPASLDSLKMFRMVKKKEYTKKANRTKEKQYPHMERFAWLKQSKRRYTDALINVSFEDKPETDALARLVPLIKKNKKKLCGNGEQKSAYEQLLKAYKNNQDVKKEYDKKPWKNIEFKDVPEDFVKLIEQRATKDEEEQKTGTDGRLMNGEKKKNYFVKEYKKKIKNEWNGKQLSSLKEAKSKLTDLLVMEARSSGIGWTEDEKVPVVRELRRALYEKGFRVKTQDAEAAYTLYKRSASKSRSGDCLFIWEKLAEPMRAWSWLGKEWKDGAECDLTAIRAYEALVQSGIEGVVKIPADSILIIEDFRSEPIHGNRTILVKDENDRVELEDQDEYRERTGREFRELEDARNLLWDGQALLDESIFEEAGFVGDKKHGMMTLRNHFFKACAFRTRIRDYYDSKGIKVVTDMFGREMKAEKIRMIITPDSLKWLKFADYFFTHAEGEDGKEAGKKEAYEYWLECLNREKDPFGIVKTETASHLGNGRYHSVGYQVLNTLPLKEEEVKTLMKEDFRYLELLKKNDAFFLYHLRAMKDTTARNCLDYTLYKYYEEFARTAHLQRHRKDIITRRMDKMHQGEITLNSDLYVLCSMPYEMLVCSGYQYDKNKTPEENRAARREMIKANLTLRKGEAYISDLSDGENIALFRYPHLNAGSVCRFQNRVCKELVAWFDLGHAGGCNIVVVSPWESNIMVRLGGADFDSDQALFIREPLVLEAVKRLEELSVELQEFEGDGMPVAQADPQLLEDNGDKQRKYTSQGIADLDDELSLTNKTIGTISNDIQVFNSYLLEEYFGEREDRLERIRTINRCILALSVINGLVIDSAKHEMPFNAKNKMKEISETCFADGSPVLRCPNSVNRSIIPYFLYCNKYGRTEKKGAMTLRNKAEGGKYWNCPPDMIGKILSDSKKKAGNSAPSGSDETDLQAFFKDIFDTVGGKPNARQVDELVLKLAECSQTIDRANRSMTKGGAGQEEVRELEKRGQDAADDCVSEIASSNKISKATVLSIIRAIFGEYKKKKTGNTEEEEAIRKAYNYLSSNPRKSIPLGLLFRAGEMMEEIGKSNVVLDSLKDTVFCREEYVKCSEDERELTIYGDHYKREKMND